MDLRLSDEQLALRDATRRVLADRLAMLVAQLPEPPRHDSAAALRDAKQLGWLGLGLPEAVGGAGAFDDLVLVHEELGRGLAPSLVTTLTVAGRYLLAAQAPDLEGLASGTALLGAAGGAARLSGGSRLDGTLRSIVDADVVTELLVVTEDGLARVPVDAPGLVLTEDEPATDVRTWSAVLSGVPAVVLPADLSRVQDEVTVLAAARAVGGGRAVLERTVQHVTTRHQFDRPIGTFQAVQHQLADVATALDSAGLAVARAAWAVSSGAPARSAAAIAGLAAQEAFSAATLVAHQLHGGMGFVLDSPLHLWSARAVADPTVPFARRELLDRLAAPALEVRPHHRAAV